MNGAVYISFFQGQLESVLEQVVQLAVQEISKTVGCSLNTLLLEAAVKEQENHRLRLRLQAVESRGRAGDVTPQDKAGEGRPGGGRTKPEQPQPTLHAPGGRGIEPGVLTDIRRLDQRGRVVDQLKAVMEQVLDFAVHELTKIVEASFDDLLLEITKMEREQQDLGETLDQSSGGGGGAGGGRRRGSENDSVSPSGSEDTREELSEVTVSKETPETDDRERPPVLSVSQDWVPILDKVFGQKWCSDVWQIKELDGRGGGARRGGGGGGGRCLGEGGADQVAPLSTPSVTLEPSPSSPQQDPRWTPLEDMEVFSPDEEAADGQRKTTGPGTPLSPTGHRSSASMLHRLLTLPSQLLEDEDKETMSGPPERPGPTREEEEEEEEEGEEGEEGEEEEEEEEDKGRKRKRRRMSLLKVHHQAHASSSSPAGSASSSSPAGSASSSSLAGSASSTLCCSTCGKRFTSVTLLHSHIRTQHPGNRS